MGINEIIDWLNNNQGIVAIFGIALTSLIAYIFFIFEKKKKQIEYVVISNESVLPESISKKLKVTFNKKTVPNARVIIVRAVNTGNTPILREDFSSKLIFQLEGENNAVAAIPTRVRPKDLKPRTLIDNDKISIMPLLLNPGDMVEIHILASGNIFRVNMYGRIAGTELICRRELPYPPGSGPEGEMLTFDKIVWYWVPVFFGGSLIWWALSSEDLFTFVKTIIIVTVLFFVFVIYPKYVKYLDYKRGLWR